MSFISNLRTKQQMHVYKKDNDQIFQDYLAHPLSKNELNQLSMLMDHPEIHEALFNHIPELVNQPNFDNDIKQKFEYKFQQLPESSQRNTALTQLSNNTELTGSLISNLRRVHTAPSHMMSVSDRMHNRIQSTYMNINNQVQRAQNRVLQTRDNIAQRTQQGIKSMTDYGQHQIDQVKNKLTETQNNIQSFWQKKVNKLHNSILPAFDMLKDRLTNSMNNLKDEYHTRKLTYENDNNLTNALKTDLSAQTLQDGIDSMSLPEIQFPMIHNARSVLNQKAMTPQMADEFFNAAVNYVSTLDKTNPLRQEFQSAFNDYDKAQANKQSLTSEVKASPLTKAKPSNPTINTEDKNRKKEDTKELQSTKEKVETAEVIQTTQETAKMPDVKMAKLIGFGQDGQPQFQLGKQTVTDMTIADMMSAEYPSDYFPPDDLPIAPPAESESFLNKIDQNQSAPPSINDEEFFKGLSELEPPENSQAL